MSDTLTTTEATKIEEITLKCYQDRQYAIENLIHIADKYGQLVPMKLWEPTQSRALRIIRDAAESPEKTLVLGPKIRQCGFSQVAGSDRVVESRLYKNRRTLFLIKSEDDTQRFFTDKIKTPDDNLPLEFRGPKETEQKTALEYRDTKSIIRIQTAGATKAVTEKKGRSTPENYIHITEAAYIPYLESLIRGTRGAMPSNGTMVIESTMNGPTNHFYTLCIDCVENGREIEKNVWRKGNTWLVFLPFWEHFECFKELEVALEPEDAFEKYAVTTIMKEGGSQSNINWYLAEYREMKKKDDGTDAEEYMKREFPITLMDGFMDTGSSYFNTGVLAQIKGYTEAISRKMYQFGLLKHPGGGDVMLVQPTRGNLLYTWAAPVHGWENRYFIFADCGEGNAKSDFDCFYVFDRVDREVVAMHYGRFGADIQAPMMMLAGEWYDNAWMSWDRSGVGADRLKYFIDARYPKLYSTRAVDDIYLEPDFLGLKWNASNKHSGCQLLRMWIQRNEWRVYDLKFYEEAMQFGYPEGKSLPKAAEGFYDDRVMTMAGLAYLEPNLPAPVQIDHPGYGEKARTAEDILKSVRKQFNERPAGIAGQGNWD